MSQHFLFLVIPDRGHVQPNLAIVEELLRRGDRVTFVTGEGMGDLVAGTGAVVHTYKSEYENTHRLAMVTSGDPAAMPILLLEESIAMLALIRERLADDIPDLIAYDIGTFHAGRVLGEIWGRPAVQLTPMFAFNEHFNLMAAVYENEELIDGVPAGMRPWLQRISELLDEHGIEAHPAAFAMGLADRNVVHLSREFQYAGETFDERFVFVGPCIGERSLSATWEPATPDDRPVVLVSLGTAFNDVPSFFRTAIEAFGGSPYRAVIALGDGLDPADFAPLPENVEVHGWVPYQAVLSRAVAFVTNAGMSSVMESLHAGVPLVAVPLTPLDYPTAQRVGELGAGIVLPGDALDAETLLRTTDQVVADDGIRHRAAALREASIAAGGGTRAADVLQAWAKA